MKNTLQSVGTRDLKYKCHRWQVKFITLQVAKKRLHDEAKGAKAEYQITI